MWHKCQNYDRRRFRRGSQERTCPLSQGNKRNRQSSKFLKNHSAQLFSAPSSPFSEAARPMVTATHLFFQVLRVQLWTTGFDSQLALRRQRNKARAAHEAFHTHIWHPFTFSGTASQASQAILRDFQKRMQSPFAPPGSTFLWVPWDRRSTLVRK